jgi:hypothetical protein
MLRLVCLFLAVSCFPLHAFAEGPKLDVPETDFYFGSVYQGEKVEHAFTFRNTGDEPLLIEKVKSSCGCTAALVSEKELAPGAEGEVRATFDSTRFSNNVVKTIYLYSNDPARRLVQFHLRGKVKEEFELSARSLTIGPVAAGDKVTAQVSLINKSDAPVMIGPVRTTARELTVALEARSVAPGESLSIDVVAAPGEGKSTISAYLLITTDNVRLPEIRIPVQLQISPPKS